MQRHETQNFIFQSVNTQPGEQQDIVEVNIQVLRNPTNRFLGTLWVPIKGAGNKTYDQLTQEALEKAEKLNFESLL